MTNPRPIILAVDDDSNDLLFLESAFKSIDASASIHTVCGGQEAMDYLEGKGAFGDRGRFPYPDFIITDLKMPGVDGFAVLEFLLKTPETALIRTVVLSGSQDDDDIKKAYWLGANAPGQMHAEVNRTSKPIEVIVVELKKDNVTRQ